MNIRDRAWLPDRDEPAALWEMLNKAWRDLRQYRIATADVEDGAVGPIAIGAWPIASAVRRAALTVNNATATLIPFDDLEVIAGDPPDRCVLVGGAVAVRRSGYYSVSCALTFLTTGAVAAGSYMTVTARANGSTIIEAETAIAPTNAICTYEVSPRIRPLTAGQVIDMFVFQNSGNNQALAVGANRPYLQLKYEGRL